MKTKKTICQTIGVLLLFSIAVGLAWGWYLEYKETEVLKLQIISLQQDQKRSAITSSISHQLEEIASEQQQIAEQQKADALLQKKNAEEARQAAEEAENKARESESQAKKKQKEAEDQREIAEKERVIADSLRVKAQYSERQADTLRYVALGRSLGASSLQLMSANPELSKLLAYYAYYYTNKYGGNDRFPTIFKSLMNASQGMNEWGKHRGMVYGIDFLPDGRLVSASNYGELYLHTKNGNNLRTEVLLNDQSMDFRYVYADEEYNIYAVSRTGELVFVSCPQNQLSVRVIPTQVNAPFCCFVKEDKHVIVAGPYQLSIINLNNNSFTEEQVAPLKFHAVAGHVLNRAFYLYDDESNEYHVKDINNISCEGRLNIPQSITCCSMSKDYHSKAYGCIDGKIYLYRDGSKELIELLGHKSRVTNVSFKGNRLISTSYDGCVLSWDISEDKIEPMEVVTINAWILCKTRDSVEENIWLGDQYGNITEVLMSPSTMKDIIEAELKRKNRDLTLKEWNDYIGQHEHYQPIIIQTRKGGAQ